MLMDIIGVAIGFSIVMLLLSLIVTSLGQATQALLRLRGRNLRYGLATALSKSSNGASQADLDDASDLLNRCDDAAFRRQSNPVSLLSRMLGPRISWLENDTLESVLRDKAGELNDKTDDKVSASTTDATIASITEKFGRLEKSLKGRFELIMRGVSVFWALVVAVVFQVSAPQLIQQLSTDPELRANFAVTAADSLQQSAAIIDADSANSPETDVEKIQAYYDEAIKNVEVNMSDLSRVNISPLRYGWSFYTDGTRSLANILGVLMTAILLTLGAPFWYGALEVIVKWRGAFAPAKTSPGGNENPSTDPDKSPTDKADGT